MDDLTLVIDIGKSHAKLLFIDAAGDVVEHHGRDNGSVVSALGYPALDIAGLADWMSTTLAASALTRRCARIIPCTHGAAFVALGEGELAWEPVDYEFSGVDDTRASYQAERDDFQATLSPDLPDGLNAARPLFWMQQRHPQAWARTRVLLPYPQYWAWWLSGGHWAATHNSGDRSNSGFRTWRKGVAGPTSLRRSSRPVMCSARCERSWLESSACPRTAKCMSACTTATPVWRAIWATASARPVPA
jgi:sugar (pentulose or hexulose) kinase